MAIFKQMQNISNDAEPQELREQLIQSNAIRALLEKLALTFDIKATMDAVLAAFIELVPFHTISYVISDIEGSEFSKLTYVFSKGAVGKAYLSSINRDMLSFAHSLPLDMLFFLLPALS